MVVQNKSLAQRHAKDALTTLQSCAGNKRETARLCLGESNNYAELSPPSHFKSVLVNGGLTRTFLSGLMHQMTKQKLRNSWCVLAEKQDNGVFQAQRRCSDMELWTRERCGEFDRFDVTRTHHPLHNIFMSSLTKQNLSNSTRGPAP